MIPCCSRRSNNCNETWVVFFPRGTLHSYPQGTCCHFFPPSFVFGQKAGTQLLLLGGQLPEIWAAGAHPRKSRREMGPQVRWTLFYPTAEMGLSHSWFGDQESPMWPNLCLLTSRARGRVSCLIPPPPASPRPQTVYFNLLLLVQKLFLSWAFALNQVAAQVAFCPKTFTAASCEWHQGVLQLLGIPPGWMHGAGQESKWILRFCRRLKKGYVMLRQMRTSTENINIFLKNYI